MFAQWADEGGVKGSVWNAALAYKIKNQVEAAYQRSEPFDLRKPLMERWGRHCAALPAPKVVAIDGTAT